MHDAAQVYAFGVEICIFKALTRLTSGK